MLFMAGGGRIQRVHGPFVSDDEVEQIVAYLKTQGAPEYVEAVTEEGGEGEVAGFGNDLGGGSTGGSGDELYDQAVAVILRDKKVSTSYIQRKPDRTHGAGGLDLLRQPCGQARNTGRLGWRHVIIRRCRNVAVLTADNRVRNYRFMSTGGMI
jgi:hypothetical protein